MGGAAVAGWYCTRSMATFQLALVLVALLVACLDAQYQKHKENVLSWRTASDPRALCNDYTRAGFFLNANSNSFKWIIFLESGSLCYSNDTCNRRFFNEDIRKQENSNNPGISADFPYGRFDPVKAYDNVRTDGLSYADFVNPLMTSMSCLQSQFGGNNVTVTGRDIMDGDPEINPDFFEHNHVIIPYCSSDLWLGEEEGSTECSCSDVSCFSYQPNSPNLQFTFRGKTIFQSIFQQLQRDYGMDSAVEVVIAGSSAGGVGVLNHAQWVSKQIAPTTKLLVMFDSSWFVNFQDGIYRIFDGTVNSLQSSQIQSADSRRLLSVIASNPACSDFVFGYPCCISAHCIMTRRNETGQLAYYPEENQRTFAIFSLYDIFLLAPALAGQDGFATSNEDSPDGSDSDDPNLSSLLVNFLRIIGEYGGQMNVTASLSYNEVPFLSYYSTQCFQHVYLATSTLWGTILSSITEESVDLTSFSHHIASGRWSNNILASNGSSLVTIQQAVSEWYNANDRAMRYTDTCQGPYCNMDCPDEFILIELTSNNWPLWAKMLIIVIVMLVPAVCIVMKALFVIWLFVLERKQLDYLYVLYEEQNGDETEFKLMECDDKDKISVSCLDLSYSVTYKVTKHVKDESEDETNTIALLDIPETEEEEKRDFSRNKRNAFQRVQQTFRHVRHHHQTQKNPKLLDTIEEDEAITTIEEGNVDGKDEDDMFVRCFQEWTTKEILKGISMYFNPGSMIGIMGPSGCGKTTFLDILTGRRKSGKFGGNIYVNGFPLDELREWYIANTGYVLQLATPFYAELTVRDNLTLAAQIMLGRKVTMKDKFKRVELVMHVTGLNKLADTVVGGETGPGLSGGQKRRLAVALQLLKLPSVVYLDEPTSGLDATSSMELLYHLDRLAKSGRTIILTIHQPRMEIFHMFDRLVLLSDGKVAYHGAPEKAYEVFVSALLKKKLNYPSLREQNPADVIMDMLGKPKLRKSILEYYETLDEPNKVRKAVEQSIIKVEDSTKSLLQKALFRATDYTKHSRSFVRMAALEARAVKRLTLGQVCFLPIMFFLQALVPGTVYIQTSSPGQIVPAMAIFSWASGLYVFPAIQLYYTPAIRLFGSEKANGVGKARDIVIQGFIRHVTIAFIPILVSTSVVYILVVKSTEYSLVAFIQVLVTNICLNLTWTACLTALLTAFHEVAFRISSLVSATAGFSSGFFIPIGAIHWGYRWIAYINPNYYALSSVTYFILEDFDVCEGTQFECFFDSGEFILRTFFFDKINPYVHLLVLLLFAIFFLCLAILANWAHNTDIKAAYKRLKNFVVSLYRVCCTRKGQRELHEKTFTKQRTYTRLTSGEQSRGKSGWEKVRALVLNGTVRNMAESTSTKRTFSFLSGEESHEVWKPKLNFSDIVAALKNQKQDEAETSQPIDAPSPPKQQREEKDKVATEKSLSAKSLQANFLRQRQKTLMNRVNFAWKVLQEKPTEEAPPSTTEETSGSARWKAAARKVMPRDSIKKQADFSFLVADLVAQKKAESKT